MLILASGSKNRIAGLTLARIPFISQAADIDEKAIQHDDIKKRVIQVARAKVEKVVADGVKLPPPDIFADEVIEADSDHLILGADGVNIVRGKIMEKPQDESEAFDMIKAQSGQTCSFLTGYFCFSTATKKTYQGTSETLYTFREVSDHEIHAYCNTEPVLTWAAAFSPGNSMAISFITTIASFSSLREDNL